MESTDVPGNSSSVSNDEPGPGTTGRSDQPPAIAVLNERDLDDLLALSKASNWNQNADDWRWMLASGRTRGLRLDGRVIASTLVLPWPPAPQALDAPSGPSRQSKAVSGRIASGLADAATPASLAWISMVLVLPEYRRQGHASRLLRDALGWLGQPGQRHLLPVLDATPAGREVYLQEGFHDTWGFARWQCAQVDTRVLGSFTGQRTTQRSMPLQGFAGLPSALAGDLLALDCQAFGADRRHLISALARRSPRAGFVATQPMGDRLSATGYVMARPGRQATQIGPLVARDTESAKALLTGALAAVKGPVFIDIPDDRGDLQVVLETAGFTMQRPFTRMVFGAGRPAPGDAGLVWAVAGPELG